MLGLVSDERVHASLIGTGRGQVSASLVDRAFHAASERLVAYGHLTRRELDAVTDETPEADAAAALSTLGQLQALAMLERLEARGAKFPAEHNVGHLYEAEPVVKDFHRQLDPTNTFNPGIGKTSKRRR